MEYHHLDLCIDRARNGVYPLRASCKAHGESRDVLALTVEQLAEARCRLEDGLTSREFLEAFGDTLYRTLFETPERNIGAHFYQCVGAASAPEQGVMLRLRVEPPEIAALPWEYLFSRRQECFLASSIRSPVVRYLDLQRAIRHLEVELPLRMLVLIPDGSGLDAGREKAQLFEALEGLDREVQVTVLEGRVTRTTIADALRVDTFHILHFIGHGDFDGERAFLLINGKDGEDDYVDHERFGSFVLNHPSLKLVVLNACKGGTTSSTRSLVGMAPQLVKQGVPAVVAMQYAIYDDEALGFAREFYRTLFRGHDHGRVEIAMTHARNLLAAEFPASRAVGAPVLFMHAPEGVLFHVTGKQQRLRDVVLALLPRRRVHTTRAVVRTHEHNIAVLERQRKAGENPAMAEAALEEEQTEVARLRRRLRFRNAAVAQALGVAVFIWFFLSLNLIESFYPQLRLDSYGVWISDALASRPIHPALALVGIGEPALAVLGIGPMGEATRSEWRRQLARLIHRLSEDPEHRARIIAMDIWWPDEAQDPAADAELAAAIRAARERGTDVVAISDLPAADGGPELAPLLREPLWWSWGHPCFVQVGRRPFYLPLLVVPQGSPDGQHIPSFALRTAAVLDGTTARLNRSRNLVVLGAADPGVHIEELTRRPADATGECRAIRERDEEARMYVALSPLADLRTRRTGLEQIVRPDADPNLLRSFRGRVVVVGDEMGGDTARTLRGGRSEIRFGYELQADAINTVLQRSALVPLSSAGEFLVVLLLAVIAAMLVYLVPRRWQIGALTLVLVGYLTLALTLYIRQRLLLATFYHVAALLATYWLVRFIQRRWFA
jgi:hypothetical protein